MSYCCQLRNAKNMCFIAVAPCLDLLSSEIVGKVVSQNSNCIYRVTSHQGNQEIVMGFTSCRRIQENSGSLTKVWEKSENLDIYNFIAYCI